MNPTQCINSQCRHFYVKRLKNRPAEFYCTARKGQPINDEPWAPVGRLIKTDRLRHCPLEIRPRNKRERIAAIIADMNTPETGNARVLRLCPEICALLLETTSGTKYRQDALEAVKTIYPNWPEI